MDNLIYHKKCVLWLSLAFCLCCMLAVTPVSALHNVSVSIDQPGGPCTDATKCILFTIDAGLKGNVDGFLISFPHDSVFVPLTIDPDCVNIAWNDNGTWTSPVHPNATEVSDTFVGHPLPADTRTVKMWTPIDIPMNKQVLICFLPCSDITACNYTAWASTDLEAYNASADSQYKSSNTVQLQFDVIVIQSPNGTIVADTPPPYPCGSTPRFDFIPNAGYEVCNVCIEPLGGNDPCLGPMSSYTFNPLDQCYNITAEFCLKKFCIEGYKLDQNNGPQSGWLITVKNATGGVVGMNTTNADGHWKVCGLIQGTYNISETMQPNWVAVNPAGGYQSRTLVDQSITNVNFTNKRSMCLSGYKLDENNGPQPGWVITVKNATGDVVGSTTTNADGYWQFCNLIQGTYNVSETMQPNWVAVNPAGGYQSRTLVDKSITNVNFTNERERFCIDGYKFDESGLGLENWNITITDEFEDFVTVTTDEDGFYRVCGLLPGNYTVCEKLQQGWMNLTPICVDIEIVDEDVNGVNFINELETFCIDGYKLNESGFGLENWNITITDEFEDFVTVTTDEDGFYQVCDLLPGSYTVCEELQEGWRNLTPLCVDVEIVDDNVDGVNFTNELERFCIDGYKLDETGLGLDDWNIIVKDESGAIVGDVMTDEDGYYQVCDLLPGSYTVCEELQGGWMNLTPRCVDVEVINTDISEINFINERVNGSMVGWVSSHCNTGSLVVPGVKVCVALTPEDLESGNSWCAITDSRGIYTIPDLPTGVTLYAMATAPGYEERPISYQIDSGHVMICKDLTCTPRIQQLTEGNVTQVNWFLVKKPNTTLLNGYPLDQAVLEQISWVQLNESFSYIPFL
jgi:hypothetical protein